MQARRAGRQRIRQVNADPFACRYGSAGCRPHYPRWPLGQLPLGFGGILHPKLSGRENALFLARLYGINEREAVAHAADFAELGAYFHMPLGTYSSGMRARLAFGACLAVPFDVFL